jgi:iron complex transport system permease protein
MLHYQKYQHKLFSRWVIVIGLLILLFILVILNLSVGPVTIPFKHVWDALQGVSENDSWNVILTKVRLPQLITALIAGAGLAVGGLQMQTLFRNPLADPSILGISSGASLGVAFLLMLSGTISGVSLHSLGITGSLAITFASFIGAMAVLFTILIFAPKLKSSVNVLVFGIMIGYLTFSVVGILKFYSLKDDLRRYVVWGLGSFSEVALKDMYYFVSIGLIALLSSFLLIKPLNLLLLGDYYAANLGLNTKYAKFWIIASAGFLTAFITAYCGPIAFIGLAVPHLARALLSTADHRILMPITALLGAILALGCNFIARLPVFDGALPINAVTALIGAPVVIYVILKTKIT